MGVEKKNKTEYFVMKDYIFLHSDYTYCITSTKTFVVCQNIVYLCNYETYPAHHSGIRGVDHACLLH